jgi:DNA modification methylase
VNVEINPPDIASPKRVRRTDPPAVTDWYGYYAGYSTDFVRDVLTTLKCGPCSTILDPWNGSGTTTAVAALAGHYAIGVDISPPMHVIARARSAYSIDIDECLKEARRVSVAAQVECPALHSWFSPSTASTVGGIIHSIFGGPVPEVSAIEDQESILLTSLFAVVRQYAQRLQGTNPTWWRSESGARLLVDSESLRSAFVEKATLLAEGLSQSSAWGCSDPRPPRLFTSNAQELPVESNLVDAVITSPPYLTRIDYAKAMSLELALCGLDDGAVNMLRRAMLGGVLSTVTPTSKQEWGAHALEVIEHIPDAARARDRNDAAYYLGFFARYFEGMYRSLAEIDRVVKPNGSAVIVLQPSRHRGILVDIPLVVAQMAMSLGWQRQRVIAWPTRDLGGINPRSRKYTKVAVSEAALIFRKQ